MPVGQPVLETVTTLIHIYIYARKRDEKLSIWDIQTNVAIVLNRRHTAKLL